MAAPRFTNYAAFTDPGTGLARIGHLDAQAGTIQPLSFPGGSPVEDLYQVIEAGPAQIVPAGPALAAASVKILAPISGRDILAVGKNYMEHAKEFNASGYDSSDKVDRPSHPVIFTKRATSIIADGEGLFLHPEFSQSVDYEGEIGVILGKPGFRIPKEKAWEHVWGYTIINDVTARERQRDHKQFYIGKSADTFCPMGPVAVPKEDLPATLRVQTHVNGELRQDATTEDLIFDIPTLVATLSEGQTLQSGDVIATGTPAGVGIGRTPPVFLKDGDEIVITIPGIGSLRTPVTSTNATVERIAGRSAFRLTNASRSVNATSGLTTINNKPLRYRRLGSGPHDIVFVHGLGGTSEVYSPLVAALGLESKANLHLFDFEGHGLSPTHPLSALTIESLAADLAGVFAHAGISAANPGTVVGHSMGCLVAMRFALDNPGLVKKLVLLGPPASPVPEAASQGSLARAALVRSRGMAAVVDALVAASTSDHSRASNPLGIAAVRQSVLGQDPEAYAKACGALATATSGLKVEDLRAETLVVVGSADKVTPPATAESYAARIAGARTVVLPDVGHWLPFEDVKALADGVRGFL